MTARRHIIPIFLPQWGCPYKCVYCDQYVIAARPDYAHADVYEQIKQSLAKVSPNADQIEVAFYGGTFTALTLELQSRLLQTVQPFRAEGRIDSIRISTHPACLTEASLALLRHYGVRTVELGVQSLDSAVLSESGRAYDAEVVAAAVLQLRQCEFAVGIQLMPGLPGDTKAKTLATVTRTIELQPDFVRVYPTLVIAGTALAELWQHGYYRALGLDEAVEWCQEIAKLFAAAHIPIVRMGLHPSPELEAQILAGPYHPAFKALVDAALALAKIELQITTRGGELHIFCNPREISVVRGDKNANTKRLQQKYDFLRVKVQPDRALMPGAYRVVVR